MKDPIPCTDLKEHSASSMNYTSHDSTEYEVNPESVRLQNQVAVNEHFQIDNEHQYMALQTVRDDTTLETEHDQQILYKAAAATRSSRSRCIPPETLLDHQQHHQRVQNADAPRSLRSQDDGRHQAPKSLKSQENPRRQAPKSLNSRENLRRPIDLPRSLRSPDYPTRHDSRSLTRQDDTPDEYTNLNRPSMSGRNSTHRSAIRRSHPPLPARDGITSEASLRFVLNHTNTSFAHIH